MTSKSRKILFIICGAIILLMTIALVTLQVLGFRERVGYIGHFNELEADSVIDTKNEYRYGMRISYYDKVFRNSDVYGVYVNNETLPEYITDVKWDGNGSPFGVLTSSRKIGSDDKIDNIGYTLKIKLDVWLFFILFIFGFILFRYEGSIVYYKKIIVQFIGNAKKIKIPLYIPMIAGYLYLMLPIIIFVLGFIKITYAIPITCLPSILSFFIIKGTLTNYKEELTIAIRTIVIIIIMLYLYVLVLGVIGIFPQSGDMNWRNIMFRDMIDYSWPIYYPTNGHAVVYYIAHWLIPSIFGKLFGYIVADIALLTYSVLGIFIVFIILATHISKNNKNNMSPYFIILIIMFFAPLLYQYKPEILNTEYMSNVSQIYFLHNQSIGVWIMCSLFIVQKDIKNLVFLGISSVLYSPYAIIGIMPFFILKLFLYLKENKLKNTISNTLSPSNIISSLIIFPVLFLYMSSNSIASSEGFSLSLASETNFTYPISIILFWMSTFGVYAIILFKYYRKNLYYKMCIILLIVLSLIKYAGDHNFSRVLIPTMFIFMFLILEFLSKKNIKNIKLKIILCLLLAFSFVNNDLGITESHINYFVQNGSIEKNYFKYNYSKLKTGSSPLKPWTTSKPEESFFFKYLAK